jgi:hypothetical protein
MEKARKKTSQALRETKELKWLDIEQESKKQGLNPKNTVCPFCKKSGHKTRIAKACRFHHQWLDAGKSDNNSSTTAPQNEANIPTSKSVSVAMESATGPGELTPAGNKSQDIANAMSRPVSLHAACV